MLDKRRYIISLDQGTTSSRAVLFDNRANIVQVVQKEFKQMFPQPGYVEHDPLEIYASQYSVMIEAIAQSGIQPKHILAIGITNQRETTIIWDKRTGKPIYNAIVWQCRRTAKIVNKVREDGLEKYILDNTGLVLDAYFSATKIKWILDNVEGAKEEAKKGNLLFGTVDTWLVWKLTNGKIFKTDYSNASRTMLFNINTLKWDEKLLSYFDIPLSMLPEVCPSSDIYGTVSLFDVEIPIASICGDQQSALFGQGCFEKGESKTTYGTGCFMLSNIGNKPILSKNRLVTTIAATTEKNKPYYAIEGSVFVGGAIIQWVRDQLRFILDASDSEYFANKVEDNQGVYIVPAFTGLGAPYWDMYARGTICGLTRGSGKNHIIRAALESIAYQTNDLIGSMRADTGLEISSLKADGGASANGFLMQFQADISGLSVIRPAGIEATAAGAAYLAGLGIGFWKSTKELLSLNCEKTVFTSQKTEEDRKRLSDGWKRAVKSAKAFAE